MSNLWNNRPAGHEAHPRMTLRSNVHTLAAVLSLALVAELLSAQPQAHAAPAPAGVNYVYDELGRLVTVVDPGGQIARYNYDAAGNITVIVRQAPPAAGIIDFNP